MLYNCLDFPAGVVPVTTVTLKDEAEMEQCRGYFGDVWDKVLWKVSHGERPGQLQVSLLLDSPVP